MISLTSRLERNMESLTGDPVMMGPGKEPPATTVVRGMPSGARTLLEISKFVTGPMTWSAAATWARAVVDMRAKERMVKQEYGVPKRKIVQEKAGWDEERQWTKWDLRPTDDV
jgi:hypothetical protein